MTLQEAQAEIDQRIAQARMESQVDGFNLHVLLAENVALRTLAISLLMEREEWKARANSLSREPELTK